LSKKVIDEELQKLKAQRSVDDLQLKELQEQLEAEQYFSVSCYSVKKLDLSPRFTSEFSDRIVC
jgi:hypothetical protein